MTSTRDLLDQLEGSRYFTSLDLASGYWQIPLKPSDAHKKAFRTRRGLFQFTHMPFGLSNADNTFQRMENSIFASLIGKGVLLVYLDDILIHTATWEDPLQTCNSNGRSVDGEAPTSVFSASSSLAMESVWTLQR